MRDLPVREPELRQPGGGVGLVTDAIGCLLDRIRVKAPTIGFDHEAQVRPVKVDPVAVDVLPGERDGEAG